MKKLAKVLLAVVVAVCVVAAAACGKGGVKLVDFPETATGERSNWAIFTPSRSKKLRTKRATLTG